MQNISTGKLYVQSESDLYGALSSTLCMIHCLATPFLFFTQTKYVSCAELGPWWWHAIDYIFLVAAFIAIRHSHKNTSSKWMPKAMYISWSLLALFMINDKFSYLQLPAFMLYLPACSLILLHIYNRKYCQCYNGHCCP